MNSVDNGGFYKKHMSTPVKTCAIDELLVNEPNLHCAIEIITLSIFININRSTVLESHGEYINVFLVCGVINRQI